MNIQSKPPLTAAEQALAEIFAGHARELPGSAPVADLRDRLLSELTETGLPTRRIESWHYTDFRVLLKNVPAYEPAIADAPLPAFVDGACVISAAAAEALPAGVTVADYSERLMDGPAAADLKPRGFDDAIGRLNGAFVSGGLDIAVADRTVLEAPLEIQQAHAGGHAHLRHPVRIGSGVSATVIHRYENIADAPALTTTVTDLTVGAESTVTWIVVQREGAGDTHLSQINVTLEEDARLTLYVVNAGGRLVREELHIVAKGEGSDLQLRGVNLLDGDSHTDVTLTLGHDVPNTTSTETMRNVVFGKARGVFQGQIRVAPDAQKTDARMASNTLLLSDDGEFSTKPELEIFADDVQCAHGATVADIDDMHLFYLESRGIPEARARGLLVKAFVNEIVEELDDEPLVDALHEVIETWLQRRS